MGDPEGVDWEMLQRELFGGVELGQASICCPVCKRTSPNPNDIREGYCGNCHDWTGVEARILAAIINEVTAALVSMPGMEADGFIREPPGALVVDYGGVEYRLTVARVLPSEIVTRAATDREKALGELQQYLSLSSDSAESTRQRVREFVERIGW